jgi:hypothetical protein
MSMVRFQRKVLEEGCNGGNHTMISFTDKVVYYVCDSCEFLESCKELGKKNCKIFIPRYANFQVNVHGIRIQEERL